MGLLCSLGDKNSFLCKRRKLESICKTLNPSSWFWFLYSVYFRHISVLVGTTFLLYPHHGINQEFFREGKVYWNKAILNEKFSSSMNTIGVFFYPSQDTFLIFKKGHGRPPHSPASCASAYILYLSNVQKRRWHIILFRFHFAGILSLEIKLDSFKSRDKGNRQKPIIT